MRYFKSFFVVYVLFFCSAMLWSAAEIPPGKGIITPEQYFGFKPGTDRMMFTYEQLVGYLQKVEQASPRFKLVEIGKSPIGRTMYIGMVSSEENIKNLDSLKLINRRLALDPGIDDKERETLIEKGKVFVLATLSMHSEEVGPSQAVPLIVYDLVTTEDTALKKQLDDTVYMFTPCHNPDGMDMVVEYYLKNKGTKYEGGSLPGVYHKYVGHDNNRDFISLSQSDTKAIAWVYNREWFPQVMVEKHQMGSNGPRFFVPPPHDPIAEVVDETLWSWIALFGANLANDLNAEGLAGITQQYIFDEYWPGSTETAIWKNIIGFLTEAASARVVMPVFVEPNELRAGGKGLAEYKKSINMRNPWPGGKWGLGDLVRLEYSSTMSIMKTASIYKKDILKFRNDLCRKEVNKGRTQPPYYYVLPLKQHDRSEMVDLVNLLIEHGVVVYRLSAPTTVGDTRYEQGDIVIPLAQAFRPFLIEVMEKQKYPVRRFTPEGEIMRPYDIASWSLPLHRGVKCLSVNELSKDFELLFEKITGTYRLTAEMPDSFNVAVFNVKNNESFKAAFLAAQIGLKVERTVEANNLGGIEYPAGSFIVHYDGKQAAKVKRLLSEVRVSPAFFKEAVSVKTTPLVVPRIALVETYFHDMDAGWTRFLFDTYFIPYTVLRPGDFEKTDFVKNFDIVLFPDSDKSILMNGKFKPRRPDDRYYLSDYPPEYTKGIEKKGMNKLITFLDQGGIIVSWGDSTLLFTDDLEIPLQGDKKEEFRLPVNDISEQLEKRGLNCPGSFLEMILLENHPLTYGMCGKTGIFSEGKPVFTTSIPRLDMDRRVIGRYPEEGILISGYIENEKELANKTAMIWLRKGKGQLVLFAFKPQFRASIPATYKLLFNSILLPKIQ